MKPNELLNEAIINVDTEPADSQYSWYLYQKFISYFDKQFVDWQAYKYKLIDKNGHMLKKPVTSEERNSLNAIANLVRKLKMNMLKHSSDSIIRIISYYLKYGFRTQNQALLEQFSDNEFKFLKNVNSVVGLDKFMDKKTLTESHALAINVDGEVDFVEIIDINFISNFLKDSTIVVSDHVIKDMIINDFYDGDKSISVEISSNKRYSILNKAQGKFKQYNMFEFPSFIKISSDGTVVDKITISIVAYDQMVVRNTSEALESEALIKFIKNPNNIKSLIADVSDIINIDIYDEELDIYYAGSSNIKLLDAKFGDGKLTIESIDEALSDGFVEFMNDHVDFNIDEMATTTTALTGYIPPMSKKRRKPAMEAVEIKKPFIDTLKLKINELVGLAQDLYDGMMDDGKGICGEIADSFADRIIDWGYKATIQSDRGIGHEIEICIAFDDTNAYSIDIPFEKYEIPQNKNSKFKNWIKKPGVKLTAKDIVVKRVDRKQFDNIGD